MLLLLSNISRPVRVFSLCAAAGLVSFVPADAHRPSSPAHLAKIAKLHAQNVACQAKLHEQKAAIASGNAVAAAYSLRGSRYVMGGTSRSGFDCSGFVRYVLSTTDGVAIPRTAAEQFYHGHAIAYADMEPGDLVFFKNTYKHGISHVGLYAGSGNFIHAANSHKGVRMDSLSASYYAAHFAGARRVLPDEMRAASFLR